jgi:hypothetical protein
MTSAANCSDNRVFPSPPKPSSVSKRVLASNFLVSASSRSRPMKELICCGRLFGVDSSERSAGNVCRSRGWTTW